MHRCPTRPFTPFQLVSLRNDCVKHDDACIRCRYKRDTARRCCKLKAVRAWPCTELVTYAYRIFISEKSPIRKIYPPIFFRLSFYQERSAVTGRPKGNLGCEHPPRAQLPNCARPRDRRRSLDVACSVWHSTAQARIDRSEYRVRLTLLAESHSAGLSDIKRHEQWLAPHRPAECRPEVNFERDSGIDLAGRDGTCQRRLKLISHSE